MAFPHSGRDDIQGAPPIFQPTLPYMLLQTIIVYPSSFPHLFISRLVTTEADFVPHVEALLDFSP